MTKLTAALTSVSSWIPLLAHRRPRRPRYAPRHRRPSAVRTLFFFVISLAAFITGLITVSPFIQAPLGTRLAVCAICTAVFFPSYVLVYTLPG